MAEANVATRLLEDYNAIRQHEYELMNGLLDVLPKIDNVDPNSVSQIRDAMFHADAPFLMVLTGPFNVGKSSIINALIGEKGLLRIGPVPTTDRITLLRWGEEAQDAESAGAVDNIYHPADTLKRVCFVDTPGLQSVFKEHEETTNKFLHRADVVLLVMQARQAMTQANLEYLQLFRKYGKKVIVVVNQADLLSDEERDTVKEYVTAQIKSKLGFAPTVWLVSAKQGMAAWQAETRDESLWRASGLNQIEDYINKQLGDADRLRQKLQTPLKIVQTVHQSAWEALRTNQTRFDQYRNIAQNLDQQLQLQKRDQERAVRDIIGEIEQRFTATADRSGDALRDIFQFTRALGSLFRGITELFGISRFFRRNDTPSFIRQTFDRYKVFEPIDELPEVAAKLPPRIEGKDMQDIDDLVKYSQREINKLPGDIQAKVIGSIQAPAKYDRTALQEVMPQLSAIEDEAREIETEKLEQIRRNTLLYLAVWELIMVILLAALAGSWGTIDADGTLSFILFIVVLTAVLFGFAAIPLRGRTIHTAFTNRLLKLQSRYTELLTKAADRQIDYGMQLRRDAIAPLTHLVESQASIQDEQLNRMQQAEQAIAKIEAELNALGKRSFLGVKM